MFKITVAHDNGERTSTLYLNQRAELEKAFQDFLDQLAYADPTTDFHCRFLIQGEHDDPDRDFGTPVEDPGEYLTPVSEAQEYIHADTEGDV